MSAPNDSPWSTTGRVEFDVSATTDWRHLPPGNLRQALEERAPAFAIATLPGGRRGWAIWATRAAMQAGSDPVEHGQGEPGAMIDSEVAAAVERVIRQLHVVGPAHAGSAKHLQQWRRKQAQKKRNAASTSSSTEARITGYVYAHHCDLDFAAARTRRPSMQISGASADEWDRWFASIPRRWHVQAHRIVRRTPKLIFALREPGPTFAGRDLDGVTVAECFALPRAALEAGRAVERHDVKVAASFDSTVWVSLSEHPPVDAVLRHGGSAAPEVIARLGLSWPCTAADVKRAYRRLSHEAHPDKGGDAEAFRALRVAYEQALELAQAADRSAAGAERRGR